MLYPDFVEAKDVKFLRLETHEEASRTSLIIEGFIFHSSLSVRNVTWKEEAGRIIVMVALKPTGVGLSGNFRAEVPLLTKDTQVLFGPSQTLIWPR